MTPPKTKKLFISYRSSDSAKVDKIARDLASLKHDDGTPRYITWQDKHNLPPASTNWWDAIVDAIIDCDMFVFHLSRESLRSEVCRAELDYAHRINKPIIPVVLEGEFDLKPIADKYDLPPQTWELVPNWLGDVQLLFYNGARFFTDFEKAVGVFERDWPPDVYARRPDNPNDKSVHGGNAKLYGDARDYAYKLAFADADRLFRILLHRADAIYKQVAAKWLVVHQQGR